MTVSREDEGLQSRESFRSVFQKGYVGVTVEITVETRKQGVAACSVHGAVRTVTFKLRIPTPETAMISQQQAAQRVTCSAGERDPDQKEYCRNPGTQWAIGTESIDEESDPGVPPAL